MLPTIPQLSIRLVREPMSPDYQPVTIRRPDDSYRFLAHMRELDREQFAIIMLNPRLEIIGFNIVSIGTVSASLVHPREVFKPAILANASAIICAHNHPSGNPTPSPEDLNVTRQLFLASEILGIQLLDHVVVGDHNVSIRDGNPDLWQPSTSTP